MTCNLGSQLQTTQKQPAGVGRLGTILAVIGLLAVAGSALAAGPTSTLYLTAGDQGLNARILGGTTLAVTSPQAFPTFVGESAIAVSGGSIRTGHNGLYPGSGGTYDLNFAYTGPALGGPGNAVYDGTTDGTYNYGVSYSTGTVLRYDLNWGSPVALFTATGANPVGITYDTSNNSLWTSDFGSGWVRDWSLSGTLLSSFDTGLGAGFSLAMDQADHTLWLMSVQDSGLISQFSTSGTFLDEVDFGSTANYLGAEFSLTPEWAAKPVPEPKSILLGCLGCLLFVGRRWVKRVAAATT
jgi:hypothetical protein